MTLAEIQLTYPAMTSINEEVENILNGKFDNDLGLGYLNDMNYQMKAPPQPPQQQHFGQMPQRVAVPGHVHHPSHPAPHSGHPQQTQAHIAQQQHIQQQQHHGHLPRHPSHQHLPAQSHMQGRHSSQMQHAHLQQHSQHVSHAPPPQHTPHGGPMHVQHGQKHEFGVATPQNMHTQLQSQQQHQQAQAAAAHAAANSGLRRSPQLAERIHCILHINNELVRQISSTQIRSPVHLECLKRLEANVSYLHALATASRCREASRMMPAIMTPPTEVPSLSDAYRRLQTLA